MERLNRIFLQGMRALLSARKIPVNEWPQWVPAIQESLNKVLRVSSRGNKTPMQLLTGLVPEGGVSHIAWLGVDATIAQPVPAAEVEANMHEMHDALEGLWRDAVASQVRRRRGRKSKRATLPRFDIGDFVLVARAVKDTKLDMTWTGPHRITGTENPFVYIVEPCVPDQGKRAPMRVHVVRMRRFANAHLGTAADARAIEQAALHDYPDNRVQSLLAHRQEQGVLQIKVRWLGFDKTHDSWEPIVNLVDDVPDLVEAYLYEHRADALCARLARRYFPG